MKYFRIILFPLFFPFYVLFFLAITITKALEKTLNLFSKLPDIFVILFTAFSGLCIYYDITHNNLLELTNISSTESILKIIIIVILFIVVIKLGIIVTTCLWKLISFVNIGIEKIRLIFENFFYYIHRYYKSTIFTIQNKEYAYTDNNVYDITNLDRTKYKVVNVDNKNYIYPLTLDYIVE